MWRPSSDEAAPGAGEQGNGSEERVWHSESLSASVQRENAAAAWTAGIQRAGAQVQPQGVILEECHIYINFILF